MSTRFAPPPKTPNGVSSRAAPRDSRHYVEPLPPITMEALLQLLKGVAGVSVQEQAEGYLHVVFTTRWLRFKDDVEFELEADCTHVRSASRLGRSDFGVNRRRVEALREAMGG